MAPFVRPRLKTIPLAPIHLFTKQMVPSLCPESLTRSLSRSFSPVLCVRLIRGFLPPKTFLCARRFFLCFFVSFSSHTFSWACGSLREPQEYFSNSLFVHSLLCQITHLFLSQICVSTSLMYVLPIILISA